MGRIEKTVFVSYRRTNAFAAQAVFHSLKAHGFDVFLDYESISSGDFESVILENIRSRAHFVVLLTPSALERCSDPDDMFRREIEEALAQKRNIVSLLLEGFDFGSPQIEDLLTGGLAPLRRYNAITIIPEYFVAAMDRLRSPFLNVSLDDVLHPPRPSATAQIDNASLAKAKPTPEAIRKSLAAQIAFEKGNLATHTGEKIRYFDEAIELQPDFADAYYNRGHARDEIRDFEGAIVDYDEAINLDPDFAEAYANRGVSRYKQEDSEGAIRDYDKAISLNPYSANVFNNRGTVHFGNNRIEAAVRDFDEAIRLKPDHAAAFVNRGVALKSIDDLDIAIALQPGFLEAYFNRGLLWREKKNPRKAIVDLKRYIDLSGDRLGEDEKKKVNRMIRDLQAKL